MSDIIETKWSGRHHDKDVLRSEIWSQLLARHLNLGEPVGRIPGFVGNDKAAALMAEQPWWKAAQVMKSNPDTAHVPVRLRALQDGKLVYMAVPQLKTEKCFVELNPEALKAAGIAFEDVSHHEGALKYGRPITFEEMRPIQLVHSGCVAVTRAGGRTGKGAGFADIELGILSTLGLLAPECVIVTAVHPLQVVENERVPMMAHDWALDYIVTTDEVIRCENSVYPRPKGIDWERLQPDQIKNIPILRKLHDRLVAGHNQE
ncbi:MAG: 5-formyltetrahydrofolate cyclo-ligase [Anaerolineae bacterium]|nr:5-formyltetrahydrofolate cyclo-ligase [Anaerolineae bacterium]